MRDIPEASKNEVLNSTANATASVAAGAGSVSRAARPAIEVVGLSKRVAEAMLGRVGLSSRLRHYPKYLSGGEQQRVALARAFVTQPPLLFADEPTGSLDATTGEAVIQLMFELNREHGSTLVLVTHDPSMAARCGRTLTIAA